MFKKNRGISEEPRILNVFIILQKGIEPPFQYRIYCIINLKTKIAPKKQHTKFIKTILM